MFHEVHELHDDEVNKYIHILLVLILPWRQAILYSINALFTIGDSHKINHLNLLNRSYESSKSINLLNFKTFFNKKYYEYLKTEVNDPCRDLLLNIIKPLAFLGND